MSVTDPSAGITHSPVLMEGGTAVWHGLFSPAQLDTLEHLIADNAILERDVTEIDLRSPSQYFFVLRGGGKKDFQRGKET